MFIHVCVSAYVHAQIYTCICIHAYNTYVHTYIHTIAPVCAHAINLLCPSQDMYVCTCIYMYARHHSMVYQPRHVCACVCTHTIILWCTSQDMYVCACVCTHTIILLCTSQDIYVYTCLYMCMYARHGIVLKQRHVCTCICIYMYLCIYIQHIHTCEHTYIHTIPPVAYAPSI